MTIIVAPDSFKGNMSAQEACAEIIAGIREADPAINTISYPLADGGEGTARIVTEAAGGELISVKVRGPLGDTVIAAFGLIEGGKIAILDMASASGIELVPQDKLNPLKASTYGTGELIKAALDAGARELVIGIGGSATVDGGIGMLQALGFEILDDTGKPVGEGGEALLKISEIRTEKADPRLKEVTIKVASDVTNPLTGPEGAAAVFGPQKGATPDMVPLLDQGLARLGQAWIKAGLAADTDHPGDGAAGGLGAALRICLGASIESGAFLVMQYTGMTKALKYADLVITGEGRTDSQTSRGKLCAVVSRVCKEAGVPVALLSGALAGDLNQVLRLFDYAVSISTGEDSLDKMLQNGPRNLRFAAANLVRALKIGRDLG
ncbi:MAG: glycerate kinase [Treponema sp.]|nr:glycerate kinase [Treponema sp.]